MSYLTTNAGRVNWNQATNWEQTPRWLHQDNKWSPAMQKNSEKLYLDDSRKAPEGWVQVKSYEEFVAYIDKNGVPAMISFDYNLAGFDDTIEKTGLHCARYITDNNLPIHEFKCHSGNPAGATKILALLSNYRRHWLEQGHED